MSKWGGLVAFFSFKATLSSGLSSYSQGISDLAVQWNGASATLFATSEVGKGVSSYHLSGGTDALLKSQKGYWQSEVPGVTTGLETLTMSGNTYVISTGLASNNLTAFTYSAAGSYSATTTFTSDVPFQAGLQDVICAMVGTSTYLYSAHASSAGLSIYSVASDQSMTLLGEQGLYGGVQGDDVAGLATVENAYGTFLMVGSYAENNISSYRIHANGTLTLVGSMGAEEGLGLNAITGMSTVSNAFGEFVVVAAAGSSSLSVLKVGANGLLTAVDHVIDDLDTRFQGVSTLETLVIDDRTYVLVGGQDDGLSLFMLLPDGRLHHLTSIADSLQMSLENISAATLSEVDGELQIFAASSVEAGITQLTADVGNVGEAKQGTSSANTLTGTAVDDILFGAGGNDVIMGMAGDDLLIDGVGQDQLWGGDGKDTFILTQDGEADYILDFDVEQDTLDLSGFTLFYSIYQLTVATTSTGVVLTFGDEVVHITSANGQPIYFASLAGMSIINATHTPVTWILPEGARNGTTQADAMNGADTVDILYGLGGDDFLRGYQGNDTLDGGDGNDRMIGLQGNDYLLGGGGRDIVSYYLDAAHGGKAGVIVNLYHGVARDGFGHRDMIEGIEDVAGTAYADTVTGNLGANQIHGYGGADLIYGLDGNDTLYGGSGNDLIYGGDSKDTIYGESENDHLNGGNGNDLLGGGEGHDVLLGEQGSDRLYGADGSDNLDGGDGYDFLYGGDGTDILKGRDHNDYLDGEADNDKLYGGHGDDKLLGGAGSDYLQGWTGNDSLGGGSGNDQLEGNDGNDRLFGAAGNDNLDGGNGADVLFGGSGDDLLKGRAGNDSLEGETGDDRLYGGHGNDSLLGGDGNDYVQGWTGNDLIGGGAGNDLLEGDGGSDRLYGGAGNDDIDGGIGNDLLFGREGDDFMKGQSGDDRLEGDGGKDRLYGGIGNDVVLGGSGGDYVHGGYGNDLLGGGSGNDRLDGSYGNDVIYGGDGADNILGGAGNDTIIGGVGDDYLNGGVGADSFQHNGYLGNGTDVIDDYWATQGDKLVFTQSANVNDFRVSYNHSSSEGERYGSDAVREAFVVHKTTGQVVWVLVDGEAMDQIDIDLGGQTYDLLA